MDEYIAIKKPSKKVLDYLQWATDYSYDNANTFGDADIKKERRESNRWLEELEKVCQYNKPVSVVEKLAACIKAGTCKGLYTDKCECKEALFLEAVKSGAKK